MTFGAGVGFGNMSFDVRCDAQRGGSMWQRFKAWVKKIVQDVATLFVASRDPRTPWLAKGLALVVVVYALSPIDLIPDFLPVIGYLDDLILLPLGILLAVRLIPSALLDEFRKRAMTVTPVSRKALGIALVVALWLGLGALVWFLFYG